MDADVVITGIFIGWFLLVLFRQLGLWHTFVKLPDIFQLVPGWRLFTGFAGQHDYSIQVRDIDSGRAEWQRLEDRTRTVVSAIWHPDSLPAKLRRSRITAVMLAHRKKSVSRSPGYSALVGELSALPQLQFARRFQFRVMAERAYDPAFEPTEIYQSPVEAVRTP